MQKLEPYVPSPYDEREQALPRQVNLPGAEDLELPVKTVPKPALERKAKTVARPKKTIMLDPPKSEGIKEAIPAPQELPKTPPSPPPLQPLKTPPEAAKTVSEAPAWPWPGCDRPESSPPPLTPLVKGKEAAPTVAPAPVKPPEPAGPPPLIKVQRGEVPVAKEPVIPKLEALGKPDKEQKVADGIPKLEPIVRPALAGVQQEIVKVQKTVIENIIKPDEMFVIFGIADNEIDFRGVYTRAHLAGIDGYDIKEKTQVLLSKMYEDDKNGQSLNRQWTERAHKGFCRASFVNSPPNVYIRIVNSLVVKDTNEGRNLAVWQDAGSENDEPYVVYRYIICKTSMNEPIPRVPLHLL